MSIIDGLLAILAPYECLGCGAEGSLLCVRCAQQLTLVSERCYRCLRPATGGFTCPGCATDGGLDRVVVGAAYSGIAKDLVSRLKFGGARAAVRDMAAHLVSVMNAAVEGMVIVPVPTAASRVRGRGFDQAGLLARELSRQTGLPYLGCLTRKGDTRQVGTSRSQRQGQLRDAFRVRSGAEVQARHILLVDDVITTGSTLETAAAALRAAGAGPVEAVVFCAA